MLQRSSRLFARELSASTTSIPSIAGEAVPVGEAAPTARRFGREASGESSDVASVDTANRLLERSRQRALRSKRFVLMLMIMQRETQSRCLTQTLLLFSMVYSTTSGRTTTLSGAGASTTSAQLPTRRRSLHATEENCWLFGRISRQQVGVLCHCMSTLRNLTHLPPPL